MEYPIVSVTTKDGLKLHGLLIEPKESSHILHLHIPGTAGNFYWNDFYPNLAACSLSHNIAYLAINTHGSNVYEVEKGTVSHGAALEKFEDSLIDIDTWIEFSQKKGYTSIILSGHSFGTEKTIYYMNRGKYQRNVVAVILMGFSDTYGNEMRQGKAVVAQRLKEAHALSNRKNDDHLLTDLHQISIETPISAQTYLNFFSEGSGLSKTFPLRNGSNLQMYQNIKVPILAVISDSREEYTIIPIKDALQLLKSENPLAEIHQINNTNHGFSGKEKELTSIINRFIKRRVITHEK